jgi:hypothetical protein
MNGEIGGFGLSIFLIASNTYPVGVTVEQFADDADPFDFPDIKIADIAMGLNGDMLSWSKAAPLLVNLAVVPESDDDTNLAVAFAANRVGKSKQSARDIWTMVGQYPSGAIVTLSAGRLTDGSISNSISSAARMKSKVYKFAFQNITISRAGLTG